MEKHKSQILAKPSGITLETHVSNVISEAEMIEQKRSKTFKKYSAETSKDLTKRFLFACENHDNGKKADKWQSACQKDYTNFLNWNKQNNGNYREYEKALNKESGKNLRKAGIRHELIPAMKLLKNQLPPDLAAAIAAHHGKLGYKFETRWQKENKKHLWDAFESLSNDISEKENFELSLKKQYKFSGPRSLLQLADRRASAKEAGNPVSPLDVFRYSFPENWQKRNVQLLAEKYWQDDLLLIRAATGAGKTDAALLWASHQIENGRAERLIIAMPTRFTSTALAINVAESLSDTGLYHSSAWYNKFQEDVDSKENKLTKEQALEQHNLARLLNTPTTVCTIDHLLISMNLIREDHHHITFNLANSCVVIDEADFYDDFTQANIFVLLEALRIWKVPVMLMSASLPDNMLPRFRKVGYDNVEIREDKTDVNKERFEIKSIEEYHEIDEIDETLQKCIDTGTAIIYANTVDKAIQFYDNFIDRVVDKNSVVVYHARFTEPDKKRKEDLLIDMLGKKAWENGTAKGIAILTQIGEMSINISADLMVSELCPIDRLTQRAGRISRFSKDKIGELHVVVPHKNGDLYPAPYGSFSQKDKTWKPADSLTKTKNILELKKYSPAELVTLLNTIYNFTPKPDNLSERNANQMKNNFINNWLILPAQEVAVDDDSALEWKSRDIDYQETVFVNAPDLDYLSTYDDFYKYKLEFGIGLPKYNFEKLLKNGMMTHPRITIGYNENEIIVPVLDQKCYNYERGLMIRETIPSTLEI